jgi:hypothetical protein
MRKGYLDCVIVYRSDRLCRRRRIWDEIYEDYLRKYGVLFICVAEHVDTTTPTGKLAIDIFMIHAERNREQLAEIARHAAQLRREEGLPLGRLIYGWRLQDKTKLKPGERPGIEPDPEKREVVPGLIIDYSRFEVYVDALRVDLTLTEFKLLQMLSKHPGHVYNRLELLDYLWGTDKIVVDRTIDVHMKNLRDKLGRFGDAIHSVRGVGYKFEIQA